VPAFALPTTGYCTVQQMRDEGLTIAECDDTRLGQIILRARRYIDSITQRFFDARTLDFRIDGTGSRVLLLDHPIISITGIYTPADATQPVSPDDYVAYNRHMRGLFSPDDRDNPRIVYLAGDDERLTEEEALERRGFVPRRWNKGRQNVRIVGVFGYTDPDGTTTGTTPLAIAEVNRALVMRMFPRLNDTDELEDRTKRHRIRSESTKGQSYSLEALAAKGAFTGDPAIDDVLAAYMRPAALGSM
jgi:hypothetical protein